MTTKTEFKNHVDKCKKVIKKFGLTHDYDCAGFILPDGKMIDLCKEDDGFEPRYEHDQVGIAYNKKLISPVTGRASILAGIEEMDRYMNNCRAIRFRKLTMDDGAERIYVQSFKKPTEKQAKTIIEAIPGVEKFIAFKETEKRHHQCEYIKEKPRPIDIHQWIHKCWR